MISNDLIRSMYQKKHFMIGEFSAKDLAVASVQNSEIRHNCKNSLL